MIQKCENCGERSTCYNKTGAVKCPDFWNKNYKKN